MPNSARENPWLVCLLPFAVFMLVGSFEPAPPPTKGQQAAKPWLDLGIEYRHYPLVYTVKIALVAASMAFIWPGYRQYSCRLSWLGVTVGIVGAAAWIALAGLQHYLVSESSVDWVRSWGQRSAFNPLEEMQSRPGVAYAFLAVRLFGLVLIVPVIEEFFLRGFLMRFVQAERWWEVPFGTVTTTAGIAGTLVPMLMHPQEIVAALVWFSAVTWLMMRTRSIWDCVLAHSITNLALGAYVIATGNWWLM